MDCYDPTLGWIFNWDFPIYFMSLILWPQIKSLYGYIVGLLPKGNLVSEMKE